MLAWTLPDPHLNYSALSGALLPLASVLLIAGFWPAIVSAGSTRDLLLTIAKFATIVGLIAKFSTLADLGQQYVDDLVVNKLHASPDGAAERYLTMMNQREDDDDSLWGWATSPATSMVEAIVAGVLFLFSLLTGCVQALAYLFQKLAIQVSCGLAPLFLALLGIGAARSVGVRYILGVAGIILWPLGWAVASLVTDQLLGKLADNSFVTPEGLASPALGIMGIEIFTALIGLWILFSTLVAPCIIQLAITTGAQTGTGFLNTGYSTLRNLVTLARR